MDIAVIYEGQNLSIRCIIANGYFNGLFDFYLRKLQATKNPPIKKNTSTAKKAPITNKKNQVYI